MILCGEHGIQWKRGLACYSCADFLPSLWTATDGRSLRSDSVEFPVQFFNPSTFDVSTLFILLATFLLVIGSLIYLSYCYNRYKKYMEFLEEMQTLDLNPEEEGAFAWMVKRYQMNEPVDILASLRAFDEMACQEIRRVLGSAGSIQSKSDFIDTVYQIRSRTYRPEQVKTAMNKKKKK
ncbi:MAG: hypothetical protein C4527_20945 [Candidatus Omnitrophota bacterium]|jgi:hypothetical protein|nr:MAG: hypothetical protein C4527_20945 [Candidatus Omnitrophota bacterium]